MKTRNKRIKKELIIKSSTDNLSKIREFTKSVALESGFSEETAGKIILAVDEACTNVIKHAYSYNSDGSIEIIIKADKEKFTIVITDDGSHFDPELIPSPNLTEYYKQRKIGGLGMFLMKKLMDEVVYSNLKNNRNRVKLVKYY